MLKILKFSVLVFLENSKKSCSSSIYNEYSEVVFSNVSTTSRLIWRSLVVYNTYLLYVAKPVMFPQHPPIGDAQHISPYFCDDICTGSDCLLTLVGYVKQSALYRTSTLAAIVYRRRYCLHVVITTLNSRKNGQVLERLIMFKIEKKYRISKSEDFY